MLSHLKPLQSLASFTRSLRLNHVGRLSASAMDQQFNDAKDRLNKLTEEPDNMIKLKIYGLFKQATIGTCNVARPGIMNMVGRAKWDAWNALGDLTQEQAKSTYIELIDSLAGSASNSDASPPAPPVKHYQEGNVYHIVLDRPTKKNALTPEMYDAIVEGLEASAKSDSRVTVLRASGDYFCSGNDLSNFANVQPDAIKTAAEGGYHRLKRFVAAYIDHPKLLIALVHGPAVGIAVTTLGLCDIVYCSDRTTFHTPFGTLGQTPEGCSSFVFPRIMGISKATEMLLLGRKLNAQEAFDRNLVTEVFPDGSFAQETQQKVAQFSQLPPQTLALGKNIIRSTFTALLHETNEKECTQLVERWTSQECLEAIMGFFSRKSKM